jgi:hypothetical protein
MLLFYSYQENIFELFKKYLFSGIVLCLVTVYFIATSRSKNPMNTDDFIHVFVFLRHPDHYAMSSVITFKKCFLWFISACSVAWSYVFLSKRKSNHILLYSTLAVCFIAVLIQWIGTEILPSKFIANLGPSRMTVFCVVLPISQAVNNGVSWV